VVFSITTDEDEEEDDYEGTVHGEGGLKAG
jgi:hypothetical protein